jgi:hypothetical protein
MCWLGKCVFRWTQARIFCNKKKIYLPSLRMKVPEHVYVLGHSYICYTYSCYAYHFYAYRLYFINVWYVYECNTTRVYHDTIITWVTADSFCSLFPYPLHNPRSHTRNYVTHMTVNGSGVTSRKVRYGSRDFKVTRKKPAVRHIHARRNVSSFLLEYKGNLILRNIMVYLQNKQHYN